MTSGGGAVANGRILFCCALLALLFRGGDCFRLDDDASEIDMMTSDGSEARLFGNFSVDGIFNNTLLTTAAVVLVGIILFEVALYALDVYYNRTYQTSTQFFAKIDGQRYDDFNNYYYGERNGGNDRYDEFPPYYDPFTATYRSFGSGWKNLNRIVEWIGTARQAYDLFYTVSFSDLDCQRKAVCEVHRNADQLGALGERARHAVDCLDALQQHLALPDQILDLADEYLEAKRTAKGSELSCRDQYPRCETSLLGISRRRRS